MDAEMIALAKAFSSGDYLTDQDIDATLTQPGKAADAAAVGDRLSTLSEEKIAVLQYGDTVVVGNAVDSTVFLETDSGTIVWGGSI